MKLCLPKRLLVALLAACASSYAAIQTVNLNTSTPDDGGVDGGAKIYYFQDSNLQLNGDWKPVNPYEDQDWDSGWIEWYGAETGGEYTLSGSGTIDSVHIYFSYAYGDDSSSGKSVFTIESGINLKDSYLVVYDYHTVNVNCAASGESFETDAYGVINL